MTPSFLCTCGSHGLLIMQYANVLFEGLALDDLKLVGDVVDYHGASPLKGT